MASFFDSLGNAAAGALVGIGNSLTGGAFNSYFQQKSDKRAHDYAMEEMKYSSKLAARQQAWLAQRQYGDMVSSMLSAGINPAAITGTMSSPSASTPSSGRNGSAVSAPSPIEGAMFASQLDLQSAQAENLRADAKLKNTQARGQENENLTFRERFDTMMEEIRSNIRFNDSNTSLNNYKEREIESNIEKQSAMIQEIQQHVENMKTENQLTQVEFDNYQKRIDAEIDNLVADTAYKIGINYREQRKLSEELRLLSAQIGLANSQRGVNSRLAQNLSAETSFKDVETEVLKIQKRLISRYGDAQAITGMFSGLLGSIGSVMIGGSAVGQTLKAVPKANDHRFWMRNE